MLQYYRKHLGRNKFKYDHTDSKWIDVGCVISTVIMSYNSTNEVYTLDRNDLEQLVQVCDMMNYIGFYDQAWCVSHYVSIVHYGLVFTSM